MVVCRSLIAVLSCENLWSSCMFALVNRFHIASTSSSAKRSVCRFHFSIFTTSPFIRFTACSTVSRSASRESLFHTRTALSLANGHAPDSGGKHAAVFARLKAERAAKEAAQQQIEPDNVIDVSFYTGRD